jgi:hypothetical protein
LGYHLSKDEVRLAWLDNRDQVKLDLRKIFRRVENDVLTELENQFLVALNKGKIMELQPAQETLRKLIVRHAKAIEA